MNKKNVRETGIKVMSVVCTLLLFAGGLHFCGRLLVNKQSSQKYEQFFQTDKEFDVLFIGSSHVINGVSPLDLFRNYGIASFNLSMHGNYVKSGYYILSQALRILEREKRQLPKVVVLDIYADGESVAALHNAWDGFAFSSIKREMVKELGGEPKMELAVPFLLYHNRWKELRKNDFRPDANTWYGVELRYGVSLPGQEIIRDAAVTEPADEGKIAYVDRIRQLCQDHGIRLALIHIPYSYEPGWQREANWYDSYAREHDLIYVNYMNQDMGIDFDIDFYDQGHLNPAGMRIMTDALGTLLRDMGVEDRRNGSRAGEWSEEYKEFIRYRINKLNEIAQADVYLMSLQDPDLGCVIQIRRNLLEDKQIKKLVERLDRGENRIVIVEEFEEFEAFDGTEGEFDLYCVVYEKGDFSNPVHSAGFQVRESWEKK